MYMLRESVGRVPTGQGKCGENKKDNVRGKCKVCVRCKHDLREGL